MLLRAGDFNGDGKMDVITGNIDYSSIAQSQYPSKSENFNTQGETCCTLFCFATYRVKAGSGRHHLDSLSESKLPDYARLSEVDGTLDPSGV